jgi:hypothetical protein
MSSTAGEVPRQALRVTLLHADVSRHFLDHHATYVSECIVPLAGEGLQVLSEAKVFQQCS